MRLYTSLPAILIVAAAALAVFGAGDGSRAANSNALPLQAQEKPGDGVRRITPSELREALNKGQAVVVDVRSEEAYRAGHIKGARLIPVYEIGSRANELPRNKMIATYCS